MNTYPKYIDLHMHTAVSDGTDSAAGIIGVVKEAGIEIFSVTDHDAVKGCLQIRELLSDNDPFFVNGVELSCRDEKGKYHILGYNYRTDNSPIVELVNYTHSLRMEKVNIRLNALRDTYGMVFPQEEIDQILSLNNPGKPHIGNLIVRHGYAKDREEAFISYLNKIKTDTPVIPPQRAIEAILESGGIPVLAHAVFGDGSQLLDEAELDRRIGELKDYGLRGLECYYSGFSPKQQNLMLSFADRFDLLSSCGSDYHGSNKMILPGDTNLDDVNEASSHLHDLLDLFMQDV